MPALPRVFAVSVLFRAATVSLHAIDAFRPTYLPFVKSARTSASSNEHSLGPLFSASLIASSEPALGYTAQREGEDVTAFGALAEHVAYCILKSDKKRIKGLDGASTGWTSWVDDEAALRLQCCIDSVCMSSPKDPTDISGLKQDLLSRRDEAQAWTRWMRACPDPMVIELSPELREAVNNTVHESDLQRVESERDELLKRIGCRLILLPSGSTLSSPICTPAGAMAYGKLLFGGATRFRLLSGGRYGTVRRAGERVAIQSRRDDNEKSWLQYGGPERNYEAVDMGPCAILETLILPKGLALASMFSDDEEEMALSQLNWDPYSLLSFFEPSTDGKEDDSDDRKSAAKIAPAADLSGKEMDDMLESSFTTAVGGCRSQIAEIVRRCCQGRVLQGDMDGTIGNSALEAAELAALGLNPVRGLLLYGPPGCGKTALAREISKALQARPPKIVSAPELLDRWVGSSEKLVRSLFEDAEAELQACNGDSSKSMLHIVVIDEIDAVFRKRTAAEDSGEATRASAVNQILAKLDGVNAIPNVLVIGMTNRRELLDDALLRPGRLEVQIEIPLPDQEGRREILQIHFEALRRKGRLSTPLCKAIDGVESGKSYSASLKAVGRVMKRSFSKQKVTDLAADSVTGGFSGADIAGLVRCAGSIALYRARQQGNGVEGLLITLDDVIEALKEVKS